MFLGFSGGRGGCLFVCFNSRQCFVAAPYFFFFPGRSKNCIVTAVTGRKLSQSASSLAVVSSRQCTDHTAE